MRYIATFRGRQRAPLANLAVVTVAGVIVFFVAHRGLQIGAHMIDTYAPGYRAAAEPGETSAETQSAASHGPEGS
jgi:hypothetical protein